MSRAALHAGLVAAAILSGHAGTAVAAEPQPWADRAGLPRPEAAADVRDAPLLAQCGAGDAALHEAARNVVARTLQGHAPPDMHELTTMLHALGDPHVRARAWTLRAGRIDRVDALSRMHAWLAGLERSGLRRCGVASAMDSEQGEAMAVVTLDAVADLVRPIPSRVRAGSWITFEASTLVPVSFTKVVVLGPRGAPRTVPTSYDPSTRRVMARFMADTPGHWSAQLLASAASGPLPALELDLFADVAPHAASLQAPAEQAAAGIGDDAVAMMVMLNASRKGENLSPLIRDVRLDAIADRHVRAMMRTGVMGHQAGDGSPVSRLEQAGIWVREAGENVAHAASPQLAHRVLWASPSHRGNMLFARFKRVGVAAARDRAGKVWVTQLFAGEAVSADPSY